MQFLAEFINSSNSIFLAVERTSGILLVVQNDTGVPLALSGIYSLNTGSAVKPNAAVHAVLGMGGCTQVFDAVVQYVSVDVVNKVHRFIAVVRPDKPMHCVQLVHVFDSAVTIPVYSTSRAVSTLVWSGLFPEQLAVFVVKKLFDFLARQVVVARVGLISHR